MRVLRTFTTSLPCRLTEAELLTRAGELAAICEDITSEDARQIDIKAQMKARLTELEARQQQVASVVRRKEEYRDVRVELQADDTTRMATEIRLDTGEVVRARPLTAEEGQGELSFTG